MTAIQYLTGDATAPTASGNKIIAHVCNDIGGWGKGFVLAPLKAMAPARGRVPTMVSGPRAKRLCPRCRQAGAGRSRRVGGEHGGPARHSA